MAEQPSGAGVLHRRLFEIAAGVTYQSAKVTSVIMKRMRTVATVVCGLFAAWASVGIGILLLYVVLGAWNEPSVLGPLVLDAALLGLLLMALKRLRSPSPQLDASE